MLIIDKVSKKFSNRIILDEVSAIVNRKMPLMLLGSSGVGKSTLLRVLAGLEDSDSGNITLDGISLSRAIFGHQVGMVFQQFNLFSHFSVEKNITFALEKVLKKNEIEAKNIANELLEKYDLADKAKCLIYQLSGGQKQRLAIARTVALRPSVICFDEPTSALDPMLTSYVARIIYELAQDGFIVVVASHDTLLIEKLPCQISLMKNGKIIDSVLSSEFLINKKTHPEIDSFVSGNFF